MAVVIPTMTMATPRCRARPSQGWGKHRPQVCCRRKQTLVVRGSSHMSVFFGGVCGVCRPQTDVLRQNSFVLPMTDTLARTGTALGTGLRLSALSLVLRVLLLSSFNL
jgi:hypothetical protein